MKQNAKEAFKKTSLGAQNAAYDIIAKLDPEYFEKLKGLYVDRFRLVKKVQLRGVRRSMSGGVLLYVDAKSVERNEACESFSAVCNLVVRAGV